MSLLVGDPGPFLGLGCLATRLGGLLVGRSLLLVGGNAPRRGLLAMLGRHVPAVVAVPGLGPFLELTAIATMISSTTATITIINAVLMNL